MAGGVRVIGLGNVLMGDDAFGPYVTRLMEAAFDYAPAIAILDLGTPGLDLYPFLAGAGSIVIVDTVRSEGRPGRLRLYHRDHVIAAGPAPRLGPHDAGLKETLLAMEMAEGRTCDVALIGVIPDRVSTGIGLSPPVAASLPFALGEVHRELALRGVTVTPKEHPLHPDIWWERRTDDRRVSGGKRACTS